MGLLEQIKSGSVFTRGTVILTNTPSTGETSAFGASYILLGASRTNTSNKCRVRLYGDSGSVAIDASRPTSSFDYSASVAVNLDMEFSVGTSSVIFNPPIIATTYSASKTFYNIENVSSDTVSMNYYPIEFNTSSRAGFQIPAVNLAAGAKSTGEVITPKSFIILSSFCNYSNTRLRLYSRPISDITLAEQNRSYASTTADGSHLIVDMLFDSASYTYKMTPILQAYNLESYMVGSNRVGYIFENLAGSTITGAFAAMVTYPIED